jgi:hypothetical protein
VRRAHDLEVHDLEHEDADADEDQYADQPESPPAEGTGARCDD